ncbi:protein KRI1 homolog [Cloeon dipterum]|uniref:protein KRI1 homolog n=1 Tax=Cloeon dipterum TaxID=197152 RepID=UPI00321F7F15
MAGKSSMVNKKSINLLDCSDSEEETNLKINENYAEKYNNWRGKEELQKFVDRYGEEPLKNFNEDDEESSSTDEDDDAREITADVEKQFFKTLACLKKKDPKIYDEKTTFFKIKEPSEDESKNKKKTDEKPMYLRDYERKMLLENGGLVSSSENEDEDQIERSYSPTFVQEQREIKQSFKSALEDDSDKEDETGIGGLFKPKTKSNAEKEKEEEDFRQWLKGQKDQLDDKEEESELGALKNYWNNPELDEGEAFLRDYILNKRYLDSEEPGRKFLKRSAHKPEEESSDEEMENKMEQFEHKYNFRFEEPDQEFLKRYPRTMTGSLRLKDDHRKQHREEVKERKEMEKEQKRQELKQLKAIKRKELEERLNKLKEVTGNSDIPFEGIDLDEDFDPEKHDRNMQNMFNKEFYDAEEEEEKPEFPDLDKELELENWDQYGGDEGGEGISTYEPHCEDADFNMDCDFDPSKNFQREMLENQSSRRKKKKRSKLAEILAQKKPEFEREKQEVDKYLDEYYGMDYEDLIGDMPTRFKYREVVPNSFGLTIEEILMADDKELNRWCSLKKTCMYRNQDNEMYDVQAYGKKANMEALKRKILPSLFKHEEEEQDGEASAKQKRKKKKKNKNKALNGIAEPENGPAKVELEVPQSKSEPKKKMKRKNRAEEPPKKRRSDKREAKPDSYSDMSDARLKAFGINPKKFKNRIKYGKKNK